MRKMKSASKNPSGWASLFGAWFFIFGGAGLALLTHYFTLGLPDDWRGLAGLVGLVWMAWGAVQFLWWERERIGRAAGWLALTAGLLILLFSLMAQNLLGVIAGGFIAVIGAVLMLKK